MFVSCWVTVSYAFGFWTIYCERERQRRLFFRGTSVASVLLCSLRSLFARSAFVP